jgi:RTA1 like protein
LAKVQASHSSFFVQCSGSGFLVSEEVDFKIGAYILIGGLTLQVIAICFFFAVAVRFEVKYKRQFGNDGRDRFSALLKCLYVSCACIMVRIYSLSVLPANYIIRLPSPLPFPPFLPSAQHPTRAHIGLTRFFTLFYNFFSLSFICWGSLRNASLHAS